MLPLYKPGAPRSVKVISVIEVEYCGGAGLPGDPFRRVVQYWSHEGELLAETDIYAQQVCAQKLTGAADSAN